jgi:quinol monooxygenase YgiN
MTIGHPRPSSFHYAFARSDYGVCEPPYGCVRPFERGNDSRDEKPRRPGAEPCLSCLGIARFKVHEGKLDEYKRLSAQAMDIVRTKDTGTPQYDIYLNDDQSECVVIERYRDSQAAIEHAANLGDLMVAILAMVSVVLGEVLGEQ